MSGSLCCIDNWCWGYRYLQNVDLHVTMYMSSSIWQLMWRLLWQVAYLIKKMPLCVKVDVTMFVQVDLYGKARHFLFFVFQESRPYFSRNGIFFVYFFRFFYCRPYENCAESKKTETNWVQNYILYQTDAKNALREKKALNPNFDYTCINIYQY